MARCAPLLFTVLAVLAAASAYARDADKDDLIIIHGSSLVGGDEHGLGGLMSRRRRMQDLNGNGTSALARRPTPTAAAAPPSRSAAARRARD
jgi:hypothetical protein